MSLSISQIYAGGSTNGGSESSFPGGAGTTFSLAAFTPGNNCLLVAVLNTEQAYPGSTLANIGLNGTYTWTQQNSISAFTSDGSWPQGLIVFTAIVTTGSSTTLQSTGWTNVTNSSFFYATVYQITGYNTSSFLGSTALTNNNGTSAPTLTLSGSPASTSIVLSCTNTGANSGGSGVTQGSGFTLLNSYGATANVCGVQYRTGTTSTSVPWASVLNGGSIYNTDGVVNAFEIIAAGSGSAYVAGQSALSFMGIA